MTVDASGAKQEEAKLKEEFLTERTEFTEFVVVELVETTRKQVDFIRRFLFWAFRLRRRAFRGYAIASLLHYVSLRSATLRATTIANAMQAKQGRIFNLRFFGKF